MSGKRERTKSVESLFSKLSEGQIGVVATISSCGIRIVQRKRAFLFDNPGKFMGLLWEKVIVVFNPESPEAGALIFDLKGQPLCTANQSVPISLPVDEGRIARAFGIRHPVHNP